MSEAPVLAVVGHPNKGKSSLVATLAEDDSVAISATPGTTLRARAYPLRVDGELLYTLVDTPGFQRARRVLAWLEERATETQATAADRPRLVAEFVAEPGHAERFPDEVALLRPLVEGAGILYVVDGGVPYGPEYEAEMEILRWTGRPSLAVINPIGRRDHVDEWTAALGQFFRVVRVVDALHADFETRRAAAAGLRRARRRLARRRSIRRSRPSTPRGRPTRRRPRARSRDSWPTPRARGRASDRARRRIPRPSSPSSRPSTSRAGARDPRVPPSPTRPAPLRAHRAIEAHADALELLEADLFSEDTWLRFGLRRRDLAAAGALGGAATGGVIDVALGGASFLLGAAAGGRWAACSAGSVRVGWLSCGSSISRWVVAWRATAHPEREFPLRALRAGSLSLRSARGADPCDARCARARRRSRSRLPDLEPEQHGRSRRPFAASGNTPRARPVTRRRSGP